MKHLSLYIKEAMGPELLPYLPPYYAPGNAKIMFKLSKGTAGLLFQTPPESPEATLIVADFLKAVKQTNSNIGSLAPLIIFDLGRQLKALTIKNGKLLLITSNANIQEFAKIYKVAGNVNFLVMALRAYKNKGLI